MRPAGDASASDDISVAGPGCVAKIKEQASHHCLLDVADRPHAMELIDAQKAHHSTIHRQPTRFALSTV